MLSVAYTQTATLTIHAPRVRPFELCTRRVSMTARQVKPTCKWRNGPRTTRGEVFKPWTGGFRLVACYQCGSLLIQRLVPQRERLLPAASEGASGLADFA